MYPRNAASPQRIAIGAVVQISDGAVQTSGVSVKVMPQGGAASAGGGTIAYEEGIVHYVPTQAETNYTSFIVIAYKTGCIPVSQTIVTSASGTAGYAGLDWSAITASSSTVNLSATTIKTLTDAPSDSSGITTLLTRLPSAITLSSGAVTVGTNNDKTGYSLSGTQTFNNTGTWTGNLSGSVGSVTAGVTVTTNNDKTGYTIATGGIGTGDIDSTALNEIADAILDRVMSVGTDSGGDNTTSRTVRQALRTLRNRVNNAAGTLTVYKEDDTTTSWTAATTQTAGDPISQINPT